MMDLKLKITQKILGYLEINYEELKKEIAKELEKYQGLVVTSSDLPKAKDTRALLNKVLKNIKDRKNQLKKEFLKPYEKIEDQITEITQMIEAVVLSIDQQIKNLEMKAREEKLLKIEEVWNQLSYSKIPFDKVWKEEYLNKTYTLDKIRDKFIEFITQTEQDLKAIDNLVIDPTQALELKKKYLARLDFGEVLDDYYQEKQAEKALESDGSSSKKGNVLRLEVSGTKKQIKLLIDFLNEHQIKFRKL